MSSLPARAAVVIVGGGVVGCSIAYHLARKGWRDVLVLERGLVASGSTSRAAGGIRTQFGTEVNIRLSLASIAFFLDPPADLDWALNFHQVGYLFLATTEAELAEFRANAALQQSLGVPVALLTPAQAAAKVPGLTVSDLVGATFCPWDGYGDPYAAAQGFAAAAKARGVRILEEVEVTGVERDTGGAVRGVRTSAGPVASPLVVDAAGAYAGLVGQMVGLDIPVLPYRRQVFVTDPFPAIPETCPMVIDFHTRFYFRKEGELILMGLDDPAEPSSFNTAVSWDFLVQVVSQAVHRVPAMEQARVARGWAGLYEVTPDHNPILGATDVPGFYVAAGFSGHGFMHSPATGRVVAELLSGEAPSIDIAPLGLSRFREGRLLVESRVI